MPVGPATVAAFLGDQVQAGMKPSTLGRRAAAIKYAHRRANEESPTDDERVKAVLQRARRTLGVAQRKLAAATSEKTIGMATLVRPRLAGFAGPGDPASGVLVGCEAVRIGCPRCGGH